MTSLALQRRSAPLFARAEQELAEFQWQRGIVVDPIPSPQRIAPHSLAIAADVESGDTELGSGRLILLHDPAGSDAWEGTFRLVSYVRADVELVMATDPLLADVGWSWLNDALAECQAPYHAASGTVTAVSSRSFGALESDPDRAELEIRASWTPAIDARCGLTPHLAAWQELLCTITGLPSATSGIVPINAAKR